MAEKNEETPKVDRPDAGAPDQGAAPDAPPSNSDETPETLQEEVEQAASDDAPEAAAPGASPDDATETPDDSGEAAAARPKATSKGGPSRREKLEAKRGERRAALAKQRRAYRQKQKAKKSETQTTAPAAEEMHAPEHGPGRPKVRQGVVVSEKGEKTITVRIDV